MPLSDLSNPDILLRENWEAQLSYGADGTPTLPPSLVAELGPHIWVADLRDEAAMVGAQGYIPGIWRFSFTKIGQLADLLPAYTPVVLVCTDGIHSTTGARFLLALGMTTVAAMNGGMCSWRAEGFGVSRDPAILGRTLGAPAPGHGSDGRLLKPPQEKGKRLTLEAIEGHLGDPATVRRVKLAAFLLSSRTSCVDGCEDRAIIGTPGGDAGDRDIEWVVLGGEHNEGAVVNVTVEGDMHPFSEAPMIAPSIGGTQMFVNHPQVVAYLREQTAHFLTTKAHPLLPPSRASREDLATAMLALGAAQAQVTLASRALGLPTFGIYFSHSGSIEVVEENAILDLG